MNIIGLVLAEGPVLQSQCVRIAETSQDIEVQTRAREACAVIATYPKASEEEAAVSAQAGGRATTALLLGKTTCRYK